MKNIITAIGEEKLNEQLNNVPEFNVVNSDIQYQEGIIEVLDYKKEIDILILSNLIVGNIEIKDLLNRIFNINNKIKIYFITNEINDELNKYLKNKKIEIIYFEEKINIEKIIKIICEKNNINNFLQIKNENKIRDNLNKNNFAENKLINNKKIKQRKINKKNKLGKLEKNNINYNENKNRKIKNKIKKIFFKKFKKTKNKECEIKINNYNNSKHEIKIINKKRKIYIKIIIE